MDWLKLAGIVSLAFILLGGLAMILGLIVIYMHAR
jgi:hypothetical protein